MPRKDFNAIIKSEKKLSDFEENSLLCQTMEDFILLTYRMSQECQKIEDSTIPTHRKNHDSQSSFVEWNNNDVIAFLEGIVRWCESTDVDPFLKESEKCKYPWMIMGEAFLAGKNFT